MADLLTKQAHRMQKFLDRSFEEYESKVIAAAIHDLDQAIEIGWSGHRTEMSSEVGQAVCSFFRSEPIDVVTEGFQTLTGRKPLMDRVLFELRDESGYVSEHVAVRLAYGSRFVLSLLFHRSLKQGLRLIIEQQIKDALLEGIIQDSQAAIRLP